MCVRSNGVRGDAERSFEFGSSDQRNKDGYSQSTVAGGRWGPSVLCGRLVPGTRASRGDGYFIASRCTPSPPPACRLVG